MTQETIYIDDEYIIKKKNAEAGTFIPIDCFNLIDIGLNELANWENGGFRSKEDYKKVVEKFKEKLDKTIS